MLTGENFNLNALQKSIKALPSHLIYLSPNGSAEDAVLCRGAGCPRKPPFTSITTGTPKSQSAEDAVLCRGFEVSPKTAFYLYYHRYPKKPETIRRSPLPGRGVSPKSALRPLSP